jgi:flagellar biosynthesis protein FlhG
VQIRKFEAPDMQQALVAIRREMGPDAVVLSSREVRKSGLAGMFAPAGIEVMVAVDSPVVTAPQVSSQTVFQTPASSGSFATHGAATPNSWSGGRAAAVQDGLRGNGADRGFESILEEMVVQPPGLSGVAVETLYEELREIKESIGALRLKVASASAHSNEAPLYDELRGIKESLATLRVKIASQAARSDDAALHDELHAIREAVGAVRMKMAGIGAPPEALYDALREMNESMTLLSKRESNRKVDLPPDSPVYDDLRSLRTSLQDDLRNLRTSLQQSTAQRTMELPAHSPVYETLQVLQTSIQALSQQVAKGAERTEARPLQLPADSPVYDTLRTIQTSLAALPAREIVTVEGTGEADNGLIYDALSELQTTVRALHADVQKGAGAESRSSEQDDLRAIRKAVSDVREMQDQLSSHGRSGEAGAVQTASELSALRKGIAEAMDGWSAQQIPIVIAQEAAATGLGKLSGQLQGIRDALDIVVAERAVAPSYVIQPAPLPDSLQDELRRIREGIESLATQPSVQQVDPAPDLWMTVVQELREVKAAVASLQEKEAAPTALPIEVAEEFGHIKQAMGVLQSSLSEMADSRLLGIQKTHEEMRDLRSTLETQRYRNELSTLRPILARIFDQLLAGGMAPEGAIDLFREMKGKLPHDDLWKDDSVRKALKETLAEGVQVTGPLQVAPGTTKVVFLVGASGAGKSLTLTKLAASHCGGEKARKVSVVSLASEGVAALSSLINENGITVEVGAGEPGLQQAVALRSDGEIIFVEASDESGVIAAEKIAALKALSDVAVEVYGVLSAALNLSDRGSAMARLESLGVPLDGVIVTQIDAAQNIGPVLYGAKERGWPISYLTTGVRVPEDLEVATPGRLAEILLDREVKIDLTDGLVIKGASPGKVMPRVVAVTSGKGGVGKTNVVANLAMAFSNLGKRVLVIDADLGLGNLDVLFGVIPQYTLEHVLAGQKSIKDVLVPGPGKIMILPTASGAAHLGDLTSEQKLTLLNALDRLEGEADVFLIDTGAGISSTVLYFNTAAQDIVLVVTPEPTSLADAYAMMKVLSKQHNEKHFDLIVNMVKSDAEAQEVVRKLTLVSEQFLGVSIDFIGAVPFDDYLRMSVCKQKAVVDLYPNARSSQQFGQMAKKILAQPIQEGPKGSLQFLWRRLLSKAA